MAVERHVSGTSNVMVKLGRRRLLMQQGYALWRSWRSIFLLLAWDVLWAVPFVRWPAGAGPLFAIIVLTVMALSVLATAFYLPVWLWQAIRRGWPRWREWVADDDCGSTQPWAHVWFWARHLAYIGPGLWMMHLHYAGVSRWVLRTEFAGRTWLFAPARTRRRRAVRLNPAIKQQLTDAGILVKSRRWMVLARVAVLHDQWAPILVSVTLGGLEFMAMLTDTFPDTDLLPYDLKLAIIALVSLAWAFVTWLAYRALRLGWPCWHERAWDPSRVPVRAFARVAELVPKLAGPAAQVSVGRLVYAGSSLPVMARVAVSGRSYYLVPRVALQGLAEFTVKRPARRPRRPKAGHRRPGRLNRQFRTQHPGPIAPVVSE